MSAIVEALLAELDDAALRERIRPLVAELVADAMAVKPDGWLDAKGAAAYLAITTNALHKLTAARSIPFEQDGPGCRLWFQRSALDAWRRGEKRLRSQGAAKTDPAPREA